MGAETKEMGTETRDCTSGPPYTVSFDWVGLGGGRWEMRGPSRAWEMARSAL